MIEDVLSAALDAERLIELISSSPDAAADEIDAMADALHQAATKLRSQYTAAPASPPPEDMISESGFCDRVSMKVVGSDGRTKQRSHS